MFTGHEVAQAQMLAESNTGRVLVAALLFYGQGVEDAASASGVAARTAAMWPLLADELDAAQQPGGGPLRKDTDAMRHEMKLLETADLNQRRINNADRWTLHNLRRTYTQAVDPSAQF